MGDTGMQGLLPSEAESPPHDDSPLPLSAEAFAARTRGLSAALLLKAIPRDCFERRIGRELRGIASSAVAFTVAYGALALNPSWWLLPPLWFLAGTAGWGLYVIGHECGHDSFSKHRRLNRVVGHLMLTP